MNFFNYIFLRGKKGNELFSLVLYIIWPKRKKKNKALCICAYKRSVLSAKPIQHCINFLILPLSLSLFVAVRGCWWYFLLWLLCDNSCSLHLLVGIQERENQITFQEFRNFKEYIRNSAALFLPWNTLDCTGGLLCSLFIQQQKDPIFPSHSSLGFPC